MSDIFDHYGDAMDDLALGRTADEGRSFQPKQARCKRCGSTEVRWRQQTGKWTLFSLQPGVLHTCPRPSAQDDFK